MVPTLPHAEMTASDSPLLAQMASFTVCHSAWVFLHGRKSWVALRQEAPTQKHCQPEELARGTHGVLAPPSALRGRARPPNPPASPTAVEFTPPPVVSPPRRRSGAPALPCSRGFAYAPLRRPGSGPT